MDPLEALLGSWNRLNKLDSPSSEALLRLARTQNMDRGSVIQPVGQPCRTLYFVAEGSVRIHSVHQGHDVTERIVLAGGFAARGESLFDQSPVDKGIECLSGGTLVALPTPALFAAFEAHRPLERAFYKMIEQDYIRQIKRLERIQTLSPAARYAQLLADEPELLQEVPLKHLASYLGITPESLSRIRARRT
ncbi:MAG: Crp/Fnr family transcriptional regulator [Schleiferiaceae bacterium]